MVILAIETSCDETAVSVVAFEKKSEKTELNVLGDALYSQQKLHERYGGVYPSLAKREHAKNLPPLLEKALREAGLWDEQYVNILIYQEKFEDLFSHEEGLAAATLDVLSKIKKPEIDAVAVTKGPGLEPALWVGINFAKALATVWDLPLIPVNHLEGHVVSALLKPQAIADRMQNNAESHPQHSDILQNVGVLWKVVRMEFPALALVVSGGHTELVRMDKPLSYETIGETQDDAAGEAFDKVARMLGLPYPGGPHISRLAREAREKNIPSPVRLPRPMIASDDLNFSFAGLKTAVLYAIKKIGNVTDEQRMGLAREFEDAAVEVLVAKTAKALEQTSAKTLILGGGVSANEKLREELAEHVAKEFPGVVFFIPAPELTTDNAIMIAAAAFERLKRGESASADIRAHGVMPLET